jgi:hypothetical protein
MADDDRLNFWNAILIALVTVLAALVAWRASVAGDAAGDNDYDGLRSLVSVQEVQTLGTVEAYVHSQAYANYRRYDETATTLDEELEEASGKEAVDLRRKKREAEVLVDAKLKMFPNKFIERQAKSDQSSYNARREIGQYVANQSRTRDLAPDPHFAAAEAYRTKTERLLLGVVFLTLSLVCLTLVEAFEGGARKASFVLGLLLGLGGMAFSIAMELAKYE